MNHITHRQTFVFSVSLASLVVAGTSKIQPNITLQFAADTMVLKSLTYKVIVATPDAVDDVVQIWCDKTQDHLITSFPNNATLHQQHNEHFDLQGAFQNGTIAFEFQQTANASPSYSSTQPGIVQAGASNTNGIVSFTIEFLKHDKK